MDQTSELSNQTQETQPEAFENLLTQYEHQLPRPGEVIEAVIISKDKDGILVDVGGKKDALIPAKDYARIDTSYIESLNPGDSVPVLVLALNRENGEIQLSLSKGLEKRVWERAQKCFEEEQLLELNVLGHNRGGFILKFEGLRGFLPFSLVPELQGVRNPKRAEQIKNKLVGKPILVKVMEVDPNRNRLILSAEAAQKQRVLQRLRALRKGQRLTGRVTKLVDFGVFVDIGEVEGLVHLSQLSWKKVQPSEVVKVGDEIEVKVLDVDVENQRVSLSRKALLPSPWKTIEDELKAGDYIEGVITRLVDFGAFVKLPLGVEGLIHTSQIGYSSSQDPQSAVKSGDRVLLKVLEVDASRKRVALSMRQVPLEKQITWAIENAATPEETQPKRRAKVRRPTSPAKPPSEETPAATAESPESPQPPESPSGSPSEHQPSENQPSQPMAE